MKLTKESKELQKTLEAYNSVMTFGNVEDPTEKANLAEMRIRITELLNTDLNTLFISSVSIWQAIASGDIELVKRMRELKGDIIFHQFGFSIIEKLDRDIRLDDRTIGMVKYINDVFISKQRQLDERLARHILFSSANYNKLPIYLKCSSCKYIIALMIQISMIECGAPLKSIGVAIDIAGEWLPDEHRNYYRKCIDLFNGKCYDVSVYTWYKRFDDDLIVEVFPQIYFAVAGAITSLDTCRLEQFCKSTLVHPKIVAYGPIRYNPILHQLKRGLKFKSEREREDICTKISEFGIFVDCCGLPLEGAELLKLLKISNLGMAKM